MYDIKRLHRGKVMVKKEGYKDCCIKTEWNLVTSLWYPMSFTVMLRGVTQSGDRCAILVVLSKNCNVHSSIVGSG